MNDTSLIGPKFILYDGRAKCGETSEASIMDTANSEKEARQSGRRDWSGYDAIWFQSKLVRTLPDGTQEIDEFPRWDIPPCNSQP